MVVVVVAAAEAACPDGAGEEGHQLELKTLRIVKTYLSLDVYPPAQVMFYSTQENLMICVMFT